MNVTTSYNSILDSVDFSELSVEDQEKFVLELNSLIFRGAVVRTIERMNEPTRAAWYELVKSGASEEKMAQFLEKKVPQADLALAETVESLADDILAVTK